MLQVISGKFFTTDSRYCHAAKAVLFSNCKAYQPMQTCIAALEAVDSGSSPTGYVMSYVNQIEKPEGPRKATLIRTGDAEIVEQFRLLAVLGLRALFHQSREAVVRACRTQQLSAADHVPSAFVPRYFSTEVRASQRDVAAFQGLVDAAIGLPREKYRTAIAAAKGFAGALEIAGDNIDLAYSLLVFSLEALCQKSEPYAPSWTDYPTDMAARLDPLLEQLPRTAAESIRAALLHDADLRLSRRFVQFAMDHVQQRYFGEDAPQATRALRGSEVARALRNAYNIRSRYTHALEPIHELMRLPAIARDEVIVWEREPYLTLAGLTRLAQHVISTYVRRQNAVAKEAIAWRDELPGVVRLPLAPRYWIWRHEGFRPTDATKRLEGFLQEYEGARMSYDPITNLSALMVEIGKALPRATGLPRLRLCALYTAYCLTVKPEARPRNSNAVIAKYEDILADCSLEAMLVLLVLSQEWPWEPKELVRAWELHLRQRYGRAGVAIPPVLEVLIQTRIAQAYLGRGSTQRHAMWLGRARRDASGRPAVQQLLRDAHTSRLIVPDKSVWTAARKDGARP